MFQNQCCDLTRIPLQCLGGHHGGIGLEITKSRISGGRYHCERLIDTGGTKGGSDVLLEFGL